MFDVISIGGATRDIFFECDKLKVQKAKGLEEEMLKIPYGSKIVANSTFYSYGGGAANSSVCFSRLGLKAAAVCNIGREGTGSLLFEYLRKEGVNTSLIRRDSSLHTGLSVFILGKDGEHTGFLERGANNHLIIERKKALKRAKWFYLTSLTGSSATLLPEIFELAAKKGIKIAFNPGSRQLSEGFHSLRKYLAQTDILLLNFEEAQDLVFSKTKKRGIDERKLLSEIEKMGAKISVVTEGDKGSYATCDGKIHQYHAVSEKVVDTTGAGDSFGATFVFGIIKGFDISYSLKIASINAASVVSKMGATDGLLTYNRIRSSKWL